MWTRGGDRAGRRPGCGQAEEALQMGAGRGTDGHEMLPPKDGVPPGPRAAGEGRQ